MSLRKFYILCVSLLTAFLVVSCANKGVGPQGGPKDSIPPVILSEQPVNRAVNFTGNTITITCNEYLQTKDVANQVLISPPMRRTPTVKALGKRIIVTFDEPLRDSTTYILDFGKAICDLNEGNPIDGYSYAFSTGPVIDTLQISGVLINAENLNPIQNMMIGLHSDLRDSAFLTETFVSIARTDENGAFTLRNLSPGTYHIYALNDVSKDYVYQPGEGLAFLDTTFTPIAIDTMVLEARRPLKTDSLPADSVGAISAALSADSLGALILADTLAGDSLSIINSQLSIVSDTLAQDTTPKYRKETRYLPDNVLLRYFTEDKRKLYFVRCLREEAHKFVLLFASPQDSMPRFDTSLQRSVPFDYVQTSAGFDTITVWLQDSSYIRQDTIEFCMTYEQTDSVYNIRTVTDTIAAIYRAPKLSQAQIEAQAKAAEKAAKIAAAKAAKGQKDPDPTIELKHNGSTTFEIYNRLTLTFPLPLQAWPGHSAKGEYTAGDCPSGSAPAEQDSTKGLSPMCNAVAAAADSIPADTLSVDKELITIDYNFVSASREQEPSIHLYKIVAAAAPAADAAPGAAPAPAKADTTEVPFTLVKADSCGSRFYVDAEWEGGTAYTLMLDSAAFQSIYGVGTAKQQIQLKVKSLEEYATLIMRIEPYQENMMIQVLDAKEQVVRTLRADTAGTRFEYLKPESYYVRCFEDLDGDSAWTTGDWLHHIQPEPVYYFDKKVSLKANWDFEETILWRDRSILEQKPADIRKPVDMSKQKK